MIVTPRSQHYRTRTRPRWRDDGAASSEGDKVHVKDKVRNTTYMYLITSYELTSHIHNIMYPCNMSIVRVCSPYFLTASTAGCTVRGRGTRTRTRRVR